MLAVTDHDIVFLGKVGTGNHSRIAEAQALWVVAALDDILSTRGPAVLLLREGMEKAVAETVAWCRRRYLAKGEKGNWFYWDVLPYTDLLLRDLGLRSHRGRGWWKDWFRPCYAGDFEGLMREYRGRYRGGS
jgi:dimethylaniline monooxygenase (N-oxide forming)